MMPFIVYLLVTVRLHQAPVPRVRVDIGPARTRKDARRNTYSVAPSAAVPSAIPPVPVVSPDHVLAGQPPEGYGHHPGATSPDDPRPPGLEPPLGVSTDDLAPRERPEGSLQKPKEPTSAMLKIILS